MLTRIALVAVCCISLRANAHEFWIEPTTFHPKIGETVGLHLRVGDGFPGEARPRDPRKLVRLFGVGPDGEFDVAGSDGSDPAGGFECKHSGVYVLGYRSNQSTLTLESAKFEQYLKDEGLDHVVKARAEAGESAKQGREGFSRAAKSLVRATIDTESTTDKTRFDQVLGFPAEITPRGTDPTTSHTGTELEFVVTHDSKPAADVLVLAFSKLQPSEPLKLRTDEHGMVRFTPDNPGMWMIANVSMKRAAAGSDVDWQSVWASLTFEVLSKLDEKSTATQPAPSTEKTSTPNK